MIGATLLLLAAAPAPCAAVGTQSARNTILEEEIRTARGSNLYDIVRALRPQWLRRRSPTTIRPEAEGDIVVYLDRARMGDPRALRQIQPAAVILIRFYTPSEAQSEFGTGHLHGAIQVKTRGS